MENKTYSIEDTMTKKIEPLNIQLINPDKSRLAGLLPVQSMDIFDTEGNYHPQGLYSTEIFGRPGEKSRTTKHGYIDMRTEVLHPKIYLELTRLKNLYAGIMSGKSYAIWNPKEKDFEKSDILEGRTGYSFFMEHFHEINFYTNESLKREQRLIFIKKYRNTALYRYLIVLPVGLRDITEEDDGRVIEDDIADLYRRIMRVANTIAVRSNNPNDPSLDTARWSLQNTFNEIYDYIFNIIEGKKGFILGKWCTRVIHGGTRNVITAMDPSPEFLGDDKAIDIHDTIVGLHQLMKGCIPLVIYHLRNGFFGKTLTQFPGNLTLVNRDTLEIELVTPSEKTKEKWSTADGLEDLINNFEDTGVRWNPVTIDGRYLALIYQDDKHFRIFQDIKELPEGFDRVKVRAVTWTEMYYYSIFKTSKKLIAYVTRYPVITTGGIYPCHPYLRTTINGLVLEELGEDWKPNGNTWFEVPKYKELFFDSMCPHNIALTSLGADFDGDKSSFNVANSENAIRDGEKYLNSKEAYLNPMGGLNYGIGSSRNKIPLFVLQNFTSGLEAV